MEFKKLLLEKKLPSFLGLCFLLFFFRYIPHPPNFTPVIAFAIYIPVIFGFWSIPFFILGYAITDFFLGFHSLLIWTWGSLAFISILYKFSNGTVSRIILSLFGAISFFIISNFGVWIVSSFYETNVQGLMKCYVMAIPFFTNTLISTFLFASLFEILLRYRIFFASSQFRKVN
jgi:hypothetical protein